MERTCPEEHLNLSNLGSVSEEGHSGCKSQNIAIRALKENVPYQIWFKWTYSVQSEFSQLVRFPKELNKRAFSGHSFTRLAAAKWQDSMSRGQKSSHIDFLFIFEQCGDNNIVNKICF